MIILFTGNGKGKTSAAVGVAVRAAGRGKRVVFIQFMKARETGEITSLKKLGVEVYRFGRGELVDLDNPSPEDKAMAIEGMKKAREKLKEKPFLLVLDEINVATAIGLIPVDDVLKLLDEARDTHILLTGRYAVDKLINAADLVSEMKEVKHPFQKGIPAVEGIDF